MHPNTTSQMAIRLERMAKAPKVKHKIPCKGLRDWMLLDHVFGRLDQLYTICFSEALRSTQYSVQSQPM